MLFHNLSNPLPCNGCKALHRVTISKKKLHDIFGS